jgi:hypothetical protein
MTPQSPKHDHLAIYVGRAHGLHPSNDFYVKPPQDLKLQEGSILKVVKPLYGIPEAANREPLVQNLGTTTNTISTHSLHVISTYDPCLLYVNDFNANKEEQGHFAVVGLQTDDSLFLANQPFVDLEGKELGKAKHRNRLKS